MFTFGETEKKDEVSDLEAELQKLQDEHNALIAKERAVLDEIAARRIALRDAMNRKAEEEKLARLEAERKRLKEQEAQKLLEIEDLVKKIDGYELLAWAKLHDYQKEAVFSAYKNMESDTGFFIADDMGLGKTIEAISFIELLFKENPNAKCLWLSKSSIVETGGTKREIQKWSDIKVVEILGRDPKADREFKIELLDKMSGFILLTNYETLRTTTSLQKSKFDYIVMDEVHKLKGGANPSGPTGMWKAVKQYIWKNHGNENYPDWKTNVDYVLMLSGTPMVNRVAELWAYLNIFDPNGFHSLRSFERAYDAYVEYGGKVQTDKILEMCLRGRMIRRTRHDPDIKLQLPKSTIIQQDIQLNAEQQKIYEQMRDQFFIWLDDQQDEALTATAIIAQLIRLRQIVVWPVFTQRKVDEWGRETEVHIDVQDSAKVDECMDLIEEANDQVVVFCNFNEVFNEIQRRCNDLGLRCEFITGKTKKNMHDMEIGFQNGEIDVLCINSSMGEGLNLQKNPDRWEGGASVAIHLDRWWNPARDEQCNARIDRQGATEPVTIYMIYAPKTVDDYVKRISEEKRELFDGIMTDSRITASEWKKELKGLL